MSSTTSEPPVVDASPLIVLSRADRLDLLRLLSDRLVVPDAVVEEVEAHSDEAALALWSLPWLEPVAASHVPEAISAWDLGRGESAVLTWAASRPGTLAVIDDHAARTCAEVLGVPVVGSLGLALRAGSGAKSLPPAHSSRTSAEQACTSPIA